MGSVSDSNDETEAFVKEYHALCDKYKLCLVQVYPDVYTPLPNDEYHGIDLITNTKWNKTETKS